MELVSIVNGIANIAAHANPIKKNGKNKRCCSCTKSVDMKPIPPKARLKE